MCNSSQRLPWIFDLEGTFTGFVGNEQARGSAKMSTQSKALTKVKYIALETDQEQLVITLPKELRHRERLNLRPGDRLRCIGRSQLDWKSKQVELNAYQIFCLSSAPDLTTPPFTFTLLIQSDSSPPIAPIQPLKKAFKILICRKSRCQKRGGRELIAALNQALGDRQLLDQVTIEYTGCQKRCSKAPTLVIMPGHYRYDHVSLKTLTTLLDEHFYRVPSCIAQEHS